MFQQTHREAEKRLGKVHVPSLVIMGTGDVDWPDPAVEAQWIAGQLGSNVIMLDGAGHHPHVEYPQEIAQAVGEFARSLPARSAGSAGGRAPAS
jgi:pimeloyl-ACP methyl ester carboxylesterase